MRRPLTYLDGVGTGFAAIAVLAACYLAWASVRLVAMYADFAAPLPAITRVVLHPAWIYGLPIALVAAGLGTLAWRPRHGFVALAAVAIAVDAFWYLAAWAPIHEIAGSIR